MANKQVFPTKGNLIAAKKSNALATMGYELMDRKRNILAGEMMEQEENVRMLREKITETYQLRIRRCRKPTSPLASAAISRKPFR